MTEKTEKNVRILPGLGGRVKEQMGKVDSADCTPLSGYTPLEPSFVQNQCGI